MRITKGAINQVTEENWNVLANVICTPAIPLSIGLEHLCRANA